VVALSALGAADFDLSRYTIDGGGVMFSTGGDFELSGTIVQPDGGFDCRAKLDLSSSSMV
jgi:hypothetical protein